MDAKPWARSSWPWCCSYSDHGLYQGFSGPSWTSGRLLIYKRTVGHKVGCLWKTGLLPSAAHGAGVSGLTDEAVTKLRHMAGLLIGAPRGTSPLILYLAAQGSLEYKPIYMATCDLVVRHASWIWDNRTPMSRLHHAWSAITTTLFHARYWASARGPIGAVTLSQLRIGWAMCSSTDLITDQDEYISLLQL